MLKRVHGYLRPRDPASAPDASQQLQRDGFTKLAAAFEESEIADLRAELTELYQRTDGETRSEQLAEEERDDFRYATLNHSALAQRAIGHPLILASIEPLLGEDCHVIANTCWRNPPRAINQHGGGFWHIDAGPHVPRPEGVLWPDNIPYPIFAIGAHIYLEDCPLACGPTGVIPGSHTSGAHPPPTQAMDLTWNGVGALPIEAKAGDVVLFVSDVWHRRLPSNEKDTGRFFLQAHYGRRDIAQRLLPTDQSNMLAADAVGRADTPRQRTLIGLHPPSFYDG